MTAADYFCGDDLPASVFVNKYALRDRDDNLLEQNPDQMHRRLAREFARVEKKKFRNPYSEQFIYSLLKDFGEIIPQGSPMYGVGNPGYVSTSNCFSAGTRVLTRAGVKNIEDVTVADEVVTHAGRWRKVEQTHRNLLDGRQLFEVKCFRTPRFCVTENHRLLSISAEQIRWGESPSWNEVGYLRVGDYVAVPTCPGDADSDAEIDLAAVLPVDLERCGRTYSRVADDRTIGYRHDRVSGQQPAVVNRKWKVDDAFGYFLGLWYGDGCVFSRDGKGRLSKRAGVRDRHTRMEGIPSGITFTFGSHEEELIRFVSSFGEQTFGVAADVNDNSSRDGSTQIVFHSLVVGLAFESLFGRGCLGKTLPSDLAGWSRSRLLSLVQGVVDSDGCVTSSGELRVVMTNDSLLEGLYHLLRAYGYVVGLTRAENGQYTRLDFEKCSEFVSKSRKNYNDNRIESQAVPSRHVVVINGTKFVRVQDKRKTGGNEKYVYTLGVADDHSYAVEGIIAQNCFVVEPPLDSYAGIMRTDEQLVQICKRRGGVGTDVSHIRPQEMPTTNAARKATGVVTFCERFSNTIREVGQCIAAGQRVLTDNGLKPIETVIPGEDKVWTRIGFVSVNGLISSGRKSVIKVSTASGYSLLATPNHVVSREGVSGPEEIILGDIKSGDKLLLIPGCIPPKNKNYVDLAITDFKFKHKGPYEIKDMPTILDERLAYILGFSYGNAYVEYDKFDEPLAMDLSCSSDYPDVEKKIVTYVSKVFDYQCGVRKGCGAVNRIRIGNKQFLNLLSVNGLLKDKSYNSNFPEKIIQSTPSVQVAFLSGYFDADGNASGKKAGYRFSSVNKDFLLDCQQVLLSLGVVSHISVQHRSDSGWRDIYTLSITGRIAQIRFRELFKESIKVNKIDHVSKRDSVITPFTAASLSVSHNKFKFIPTGDQRLSHSDYEQLKEFVDIPEVLISDEVVSIDEIGERDTYDLQLDAEHLFYCEGFYVHNSGRRGALMLTLSVHHPEVLDFARMKLDPKKVTGANVSVRLTDEFLKAVDAGTEYEQRWPVTGTPVMVRKVNAREVWHEIIKCAHARAEPGLLFWDQIIRESPADCYAADGFQTVSTNPCCFAASDNVWVITRDGIKEIKDITPGTEVWVDDCKTWKKSSGYFKAGSAPVFKITFANKEVLRVTDNHKFLTAKARRDGTKIVYDAGDLVRVSDLRPGDDVLLNVSEPTGVRFGNLGTEDEGYVLGWLTGDGCLSFTSENQDHPTTILDFWAAEKEVGAAVLSSVRRMGHDLSLQSCKENGKKRISSHIITEQFIEKYKYNIWLFKSKSKINPFLFEASREFITAYLSAYFSADGTVLCNHETKAYSVQLASINKAQLQQVRQLLLLFGVKSSIGLMRAAGESTFPNGGGTYKTQDCYRLTITGIENIGRFSAAIRLLSDTKRAKIESIAALTAGRGAKESNRTKIIGIEQDGVEEVGCIEVEDLHRFSANGIMSGNSELGLCTLDSCRLLLLNLFCFVDRPFEPTASFDFDRFYDRVKIAQRLMDDLVDLEVECVDRIINKIKSDPEPFAVKARELDMWKTVREKCVNGRRTGTGITALGDAMAAVGIRYGSEASVAFTAQVYKTLKFGCYRASVDMAEELGPFPVWAAEKEGACPFLNRIAEETLTLPGGNVSGKELVADMARVGRRNIALLTTAPAGSVSIVAGPRPYFGTTSGIEPLFTDVPYVRRKKVNHADKDARVDFVDGNGDKWTNYTVYHSKLKMWMDVTGKTDYTKSPYHGCCAEDLDWRQRVKLQAAAQAHIDHSISSTLNLPADVTVEKVAEIYETAWKAGCKGITVYRKGCRDGVLVDATPAKIVAVAKHDAPKRPADVPCHGFKTKVKGEDFFVIVGLLGTDPYEVFAGQMTMDFPKLPEEGNLRKLKRGKYDLVVGDEVVLSDIAGRLTDDQEAVTRLVSTSLRHGADIAYVVHQLEKVRGAMNGFAKAVARVLKKYVKDGTKVSGETCGGCGSEALSRQEGCILCRNCGWSKCG